MIDHTTYLAKLKKAHLRKPGFWTRVSDEEPEAPKTSECRRPAWVMA
jgi:hypothetical protein